MNDNDFNSLKSDIEVMLEALHGEIDPRRIIVMRSVGQIHITTEVSNFDGAIYDNEPVPDDQNEGK